MGHILTNLIPDIYAALDIVRREMVGLIPAVTYNPSIERAALNEVVRVPVVPDLTSTTFSPSMTITAGSGSTVGNVQVALNKSKVVPIPWEGEETKGLQNAGTYGTIRADFIAQGIRTLINEIEADIWAEAYKNASRAFGTAGTAPFNTADDLSDFAGVLRILEENGMGRGDLQLALGHSAVNNLRAKQKILTRVNEAGSSDMLRDGMTDRVMGFALRHSHAIGIHTKGTGTGYLTNSVTTNAIGDTLIPADTGSNTILAGDIVTFADESPAHKYVVNTALAGGSFAIGKPGLRNAVPDGKAITVGNSYTPNLAFARSAIVLAMRPPAMPEGGDAGETPLVVQDPITGLTFDVATYAGQGMRVLQIRSVWGTRVVKTEGVATLIG